LRSGTLYEEALPISGYNDALQFGVPDGLDRASFYLQTKKYRTNGFIWGGVERVLVSKLDSVSGSHIKWNLTSVRILFRKGSDMNTNFVRRLAGFICLLALQPSTSIGQELISRTEVGRSDEKDAQIARAKIQEEVIKKVSLELIEKMVGPKQFQKDVSLYEKRILPEYERYIPLIRPAAPQSDRSGTSIKFDLSISRSSLEQLLRSKGLIKSGEAPALVLPLIVGYDQVGWDTFDWWSVDTVSSSDKAAKNNSMLPSLYRRVLEELKERFKTQGIQFVETNAKTAQKLEGVPAGSIKSDVLKKVSSDLGANLVLRGSFGLDRVEGEELQYEWRFRMSMVHPESGRVLSEINESFRTTVGDPKKVVMEAFDKGLKESSDLIASVAGDVWKRGLVFTERVGILVRGDVATLNPKDIKEAFTRDISSIKSIHERVFQNDLLYLEANVEGGLAGVKLDKGWSLKLAKGSLQFVEKDDERLAFKFIP